MAKILCYQINDFVDIAPPDLDAVKYEIDVTILPKEKIGEPDEKTYTRHVKVDIECVDTLKQTWIGKADKLNNGNFPKILYFKARKKFEEKLKADRGEIKEPYEFSLDTGNSPEKCPYDPDKIEIKIGEWFEVEIPIGF